MDHVLWRRDEGGILDRILIPGGFVTSLVGDSHIMWGHRLFGYSFYTEVN